MSRVRGISRLSALIACVLLSVVAVQCRAAVPPVAENGTDEVSDRKPKEAAEKSSIETDRSLDAAQSEPDAPRIMFPFAPLSSLFRGPPLALDQHADSPALPSRMTNGGLGSVLDSLGTFGGHAGYRSHIFQLPGMLDTALAGFAALRQNSEFSLSPDKKVLYAKLNMPASHAAAEKDAKRSIHVGVVGHGAHLRVRVETMSTETSMVSDHVIQLPVRVTQEGLQVTPNPDGSVTVALKVIDAQDVADTAMDESTSGRWLSPARLFLSTLFGPGRSAAVASDGSNRQSAESNTEDHVDSLPSAYDVERCREEFPGIEYRLQARQCLCKLTPGEKARSVCFAGVLSSAVKIARRLGKDDFATDAKHAGIECAGHASSNSACLQEVTEKTLRALYGDVSSGIEKKLSDRILAAIESEDTGPSTRPRRAVGTFMGVVTFAVGVVLLLVVGLSKTSRLLLSGSDRHGLHRMNGVGVRSSSRVRAVPGKRA